MNRLPLALSVTALAVALLGVTPLGEAAGDAVAEVVLPRGSVGTAELRDGAVTAAKVKDGSLLARDFKVGDAPRGPVGARGKQGPPGPQGEPGTIEGVAAGGDLAGAYPAPTLAPDAIESADVRDRSLRLADTAVLSGQARVDAPSIGAHSCLSLRTTVPGVKPYDRALVLPTQNLPLGVSVTPIFNTNLAGRILFRVCNATGKAVDPPLGAWAYVVWR